MVWWVTWKLKSRRMCEMFPGMPFIWEKLLSLSFENLRTASIYFSFSCRMSGEYPVVPPRDPSFSSLHLVCVPVRLTQWSTCLTYNRALYILRHHGNTFWWHHSGQWSSTLGCQVLLCVCRPSSTKTSAFCVALSWKISMILLLVFYIWSFEWVFNTKTTS